MYSLIEDMTDTNLHRYVKSLKRHITCIRIGLEETKGVDASKDNITMSAGEDKMYAHLF